MIGAAEKFKAAFDSTAKAEIAATHALAEVIPISSASENPDDAERRVNLTDELLVEAEVEAKRQDDIARKNAVANLVTNFNVDHFVSVEGGVTSVYREAFDHELGRDRLDRMGVSAFRTLHSNEIVSVIDKDANETRKPAGAIWLNHPKRRTYSDGIALLPGGSAPAGIYNLWRGFGCEPMTGATVHDVMPALAHIKRVVCSDDIRAFNYALGWLASAVQHPERQAEVALVLIGRRGTGKGVLGRWFRDLYGMHGMHIQHPRHLTGNFNAHLQTCLAMFVDEAFFAGDKAGNAVLKSLITEDQMTVEKKGIDVISVRNRLKIIMATNEEHAILASEDERRYFVLRASDIKAQNHEYFGKLDIWWKGGGKEAFLGYLLDFDLTGFNIRKVPNTAALERQKLQSLSPLGAWLFDCLQEGKLNPRYTHGHGKPPLKWPTEQPRAEIATTFTKYVADHGHRYVNTSTDAIGAGIRRFIGIDTKREGAGDRRHLWIFPELNEARQQFATRLGLEHFEWGDAEGDESETNADGE